MTVKSIFLHFLRSKVAVDSDELQSSANHCCSFSVISHMVFTAQLIGSNNLTAELSAHAQRWQISSHVHPVGPQNFQFWVLVYTLIKCFIM